MNITQRHRLFIYILRDILYLGRSFSDGEQELLLAHSSLEAKLEPYLTLVSKYGLTSFCTIRYLPAYRQKMPP